MKNQWFRYLGLNSAWLAMLMLVISPIPLAAQGPILMDAVPTCRPLDHVDPQAFEPSKEFWLQAWDRELVVGEEGMALGETSNPGHWDLFLSNKTAGRWVDQGTFIETSRIPVDLGSRVADQAFLEPTGMTRIDRYVVSGTAVGSTGNSVAVTALVSDLGNDEKSLARSFSVIQVGADLEVSLGFAESFAARISGSEQPEELAIEKSGPQHCASNCASERSGRYALCNAGKNACIAVATAAAAACAVACVGSTVALPICLGLCDLAFAGALGLCAVGAAACIDSANSAYTTCINGCNCSIFGEKFFCGG